MNTTFFQDFLRISTWQTGIFVAILIGIFILLRALKNKVDVQKRLLLATIVGAVLGFAILFMTGFSDEPLTYDWVQETSAWYGLIANGFVRLLQMIVVPLVLVSIIRVISTMEASKSLGKLVFRSVGMLIGMTLIAAGIAVALSQIFGLGVGYALVYGTEEVREVTSIVDTIFGLIPNNPFDVLSRGAIIPTVAFAAFLGLSIRTLKEKQADVIEPFVKLIEASYALIMEVARRVIGWLEYAIVALLSMTIASRGLGVFIDVALFFFIFVGSVAIMLIVHLLILAASGLSPITYLKNVAPALILAFTSRTSLGTLPVSVKSLTERAGLRQGTATFITSLGANGGMNGSAGIYSAMITVLIANMVGVPIDAAFIVMLFIVIALSSFGIAGVPGGVLLVISIPLTALGLGDHFALIAAVFAIDPILDMFRTFINVNGALTTSLVVGKSFGEVDLDVYRNNAG